jgi:hypothetical protein
LVDKIDFSTLIYMSINFSRCLDPIQAAAQQHDRDRYVDDLFEPIEAIYRDTDTSFIVEDFLPKGALVMLAGGPKDGKTCIATALALAVATGTPFAGMPTRQSAVLWLSQEESRRERYEVLNHSALADLSTPLFTCFSHLPIDTEDGIELLTEWVNRTQARLIVVDPLHAATSGRSLADGWSARKSVQPLKQFCANAGVTCLVLHHAKDLGRIGFRPRVGESDQIAATASMNIVLRYRELTPRETSLPLGVRNEREGEGAGDGGPRQAQRNRKKDSGEKRAVSSIEDSRIRVIEDSSKPRLVSLFCTGRGDFANRIHHLVSHGPVDFQIADHRLFLPPTEPAPLMNDERRIMELLARKSKNSAQLVSATGWTDVQVRNAVTRLRQKGFVRLVDSKRWPRRYRLTHAIDRLDPENPGSKEPAEDLD